MPALVTECHVKLVQSALRGLLWAYASFFGSRLVTMLTTAILARLLVPEDFGVIGFAIVLLNFVDATRNFGVNEALIYNDKRVEDAADTAFILNIAIGLFQTITMLLLAPLATRFINDPRIINIVRIMSLVF